jgi:phosphate/phosphite/phosphonate ABC transporter binding protein
MSDEAVRIVFGLSAQGRPEIEAPLEELLAWVSSRAGVTLSHVAAPTYERLAERVQEGDLDLAWLPPLVYVRLERKQLVVPLVTLHREGRDTYQAVLVVRAGSEIRALADLKGKRAAWVDPLSAAGYVLPRGQLHARDLAPEGLFADERFFGSHPGALDAVRSGDADVAGTHGAADETELLVQQGQADPALRVLATFGGIPADVIAAKKSLGEDVRAKIAQALVDAGADPAMRPLVRQVFGASSFVLGSEASYAGWHRSLPAALASGLLVAIDADEA